MTKHRSHASLQLSASKPSIAMIAGNLIFSPSDFETDQGASMVEAGPRRSDFDAVQRGGRCPCPEGALVLELSVPPQDFSRTVHRRKDLAAGVASLCRLHLEHGRRKRSLPNKAHQPCRAW